MLEGVLAPWHLLIIALLLVVVFGSKRLPEAARSLGRSARILKAETRGLHEDDAQAAASPPVAPPQQSLPPGARFDPYTGAPLPSAGHGNAAPTHQPQTFSYPQQPVLPPQPPPGPGALPSTQPGLPTHPPQ